MYSNQVPSRVYVNEVGTRDGFQSESLFVPTVEKIALINQLSQTGLHKIEVTSFVSPRAIPNLADAEQVMLGIERHPEVTYTTLVPNEKGAERALQCQADEINLVMSVSESHNLANMRMTYEQSLAQFERIVKLVDGEALAINGSIATAFGCPYEGAVDSARVLTLVERYLQVGIQSISLCDTSGMAAPKQVNELCQTVIERYPELEVTLHFHNTRGMGLANVLAALAAGVRYFDASLGGIGGCPYAPGATGNICTEDLVHMLEAMDINTAVELELLLNQARKLPELLGHEVPGQVSKAGSRWHTNALPESVIQLREQNALV